MLKCWFVFLMVLSLGCCAGRPNFVFVLTDDQDLVLNGLVPMHKTLKLVARKGVTFQNAFVNSPICCPSRSSLLTGKFLHNTGVRNNSISGDCSSQRWQQDHEGLTFPAILRTNGYHTFYAGKYLNQYGSHAAGGVTHVPLGYDWWIGLKGNSKYYNYTLSINGTGQFFGDEYLTDVLKNYALDFLNQKRVKGAPFLAIIATPAPHSPSTPAPRHADKFPGVKALRTPAFNYTPENKHWLLNLPPIHLPEDVKILDEMQRHRMQSLLAVDELVEDVITKLKNLNILKNTYIIFTSDNGFHIGQFGLPWDKRQPYDTDIRVPFFIRGPGVPRNSLSNYPMSLVDLAPTILDLAEIPLGENMDGSSIKEAIFDPASEADRIVLVEYSGEGSAATISPNCPWRGDSNLSECVLENWCKCQDSRNNTYTCLRHISSMTDHKYCQFKDSEGFIETYNLNADPYELDNTRTPSELYKSILEQASICMGSQCAKILSHEFLV